MFWLALLGSITFLSNDSDSIDRDECGDQRQCPCSIIIRLESQLSAWKWSNRSIVLLYPKDCSVDRDVICSNSIVWLSELRPTIFGGNCWLPREKSISSDLSFPRMYWSCCNWDRPFPARTRSSSRPLESDRWKPSWVNEDSSAPRAFWSIVDCSRKDSVRQSSTDSVRVWIWAAPLR